MTVVAGALPMGAGPKVGRALIERAANPLYEPWAALEPNKI